MNKEFLINKYKIRIGDLSARAGRENGNIIRKLQRKIRAIERA